MTTENILAPVAALTIPDSAVMISRAQSALTFIDCFIIDSNETFELAADELKAIKTKAKAIEEQRTSITGPLNGVLKAVNALFGGPADLLARAESSLKGKMLAWQTEQERIAAEARRKAEAEAAAERKRLADEAAARQREAEEQAAAARIAKQAGDEQAAAIATSNAQRATAEAQAAESVAQMSVAVVVPIAQPKAKGISTSKKLDFEVVNFESLVKHIAAHPELLQLLRVDDVRLRAYVRGLGTACALPGVNVSETAVMSARA